MKVFEKPLTAQEEKYYLAKYKEGDEKAKDILIEKNMRLVAHMVKKYISNDRDTDDLISVGTIGLIKAVKTYNDDKSTRLATYAAKCIDNELLMMLRGDKRKAKDVSMYEPIGTDKEGNEISLIEVVGAEEKDTVDEYVFKQNVQAMYKSLEEVLTKREKDIIIQRYGLFGSEGMTQKQLAEKMNISRSYVSRIEKKALMKLRDAIEHKKW